MSDFGNHIFRFPQIRLPHLVIRFLLAVFCSFLVLRKNKKDSPFLDCLSAVGFSKPIFVPSCCQLQLLDIHLKSL